MQLEKEIQPCEHTIRRPIEPIMDVVVDLAVAQGTAIEPTPTSATTPLLPYHHHYHPRSLATCVASRREREQAQLL